jgi:HSP20 family protein
MDPFDDIERLNKHFRKMLEGLMGGSRVEIFTPFHGPRMEGVGGYREPLVDIRHEGKKLTVTAEVPGVERKDIGLKVRRDDLGNHVLVITAQRRERSERKEEGASFSAISSMSYHKEVTLPVRVKKDTAHASYKNGILEVAFEPAEPAKEEKGTDIPVK